MANVPTVRCQESMRRTMDGPREPCGVPACAIVAGKWYCVSHLRDLAQHALAERDVDTDYVGQKRQAAINWVAGGPLPRAYVERIIAEVVSDVVKVLQHIDTLDEIPGAQIGLPEYNVLWDAANLIERRFAPLVSERADNG